MAKKKVRVRSKRLEQLDETKFELALWLISGDLVKDETSPSSAPVKKDEPVEPGEEAA
jgi:hypothetical protein